MFTCILDRYRPQAAWFRHNPQGIHGLAHAARVLVWTEQLAQSLVAAGSALDLEVVRWAAAVHDVGRVNDGRDPEHGLRSGDWAAEHPTCFEPPLSPDQLAQLKYICTWHVPDDRHAPEMTAELTCLKDADALDRVRIYDLDPTRLRTLRAHALPTLAEHLFAASRHRPGDPWEAVRACALEIGLWV